MIYIYSIIFAAIQALTEFLPISSSAHLLIAHQLFNSPLLDNLSFDVMLHGGTLLAILFYFKNDLIKIVKAVFSAAPIGEGIIYRKLGWLIVVSALPAVLVGYFFNDLIENNFHNINWIVLPLIIGAILFWLAEYFSAKTKILSQLNWWSALLIGVMQIFAFIPGASRSGMTILGGLWSGLKREEAARFAFLMSIPAILGAVIKKIADIFSGDFYASLLIAYLIGFICSALFGYLVIKYFIQFTKKYSLNIFAWYRIVLAVALLVWLANSI